MLTEPTLDKLKALRFTALAEAWLEQQQSHDISKLDFDERFGLLVDAEYLHRHNRRLARRLKDARLRHNHACVEDFDAPARRGLDASRFKKLATCSWIEEHLNVIVTGPHWRRQDRNQPTTGPFGESPIPESRSDKVHGSGLCRPRRGADRARSCRRGDPDGARGHA